MPSSKSGLAYVAKPVTELDASERAVWLALVDRYPDNRRAFMSLAYADAVAAVNASAIVMVVYEDTQPVAFLPLQRRPDIAGRCGVYEPIGGVMSDYFGLVSLPDFHLDLPSALRACRLPAVAFTHLETAQLQHGLPAEQPRTGLQTVIEPPVDEFWARLRQMDKKFVSDTERRERKLATDHGEVRFALESDQAEADLGMLVALKCEQYERTSKQQAPLFEQHNVALLQQLLAARSPQCSGVLSTLKCGERLVAAHFGLRCHETLHYWFPVYDPAFSSYAPGRILFRHVLEAVAQQGVTVIDRGEGDTPAKRDFANREHQFYRGLWSAGNVRSAGARAVLSLLWRLGV